MLLVALAVGSIVVSIAILYVGQVIAVTRGLNPWIGFLLGVVFPAGLVVLLLVPPIDTRRTVVSRRA